MKKFLTVLFVAFCFLGILTACSNGKKSSNGILNVKDPETLEEKSAYSMGTLIYRSNGSYLGLKDSNIGAFLRGMYDESQGKALYTDEEAQAFITSYSEIVLSEMQTKNLEAAEAFLAGNKGVEGVVETDSRLQYMVITEGNGEKPTDNSTVDVYYKLSNVDGDVIEEVKEENGPVSFPVNGLVPGISEGLKLMSLGSKYKFWVHPDLGYGEYGQGNIEPNQLLVFEFELVGIK